MVNVVQTPTGILSYPHFFKPRPVVEGGQPRYSANLIFDEVTQKDPAYLKRCASSPTRPRSTSLVTR